MADLSGKNLVGRTISHYHVIAQLGAGGMGVVYRAEDVRLGRPVAVKFVADDLTNDPHAVARLRAEARAASALNHPNICTIYDIGTDDGHPFIVMELMEGQTLRDRLTRGRLKTHELVELGLQVADALQGAHGAGIIHRDIKPANIFLTGRGQVKILDFGLAKLTLSHPGTSSATTETPGHTVAGTTLGTVSYMSPEQASGEELDARTDLFSLGVVLYECATGRPPFEGKTTAVILSAILNRAPTLPSVLNPDLPSRLQDVVMTCLEKDRELRYQSAAEVRADLKRIRRDIESDRAPVDRVSRSAPLTAAKPTSDTVPTVLALQTSTSGSAVAAPYRRARGLALAVLAIIVLAGGVYEWRRARRPVPAGSGDARAVSSATVQGRLTLAQSSLRAGNYRSAQSYAAEVLALDPNEATALAIQRDAAALLARFDAAVTRARERLAEGDLQEASRALATARDIDPTAPPALEIGAALAKKVRDIEAASQPRQRTPTEPRPPAPASAAAASTSPRAAEQTRAPQVPDRPATTTTAPPSNDVVERTLPPQAPPVAAPPIAAPPPQPQTATPSTDVRPPVAATPRPTPPAARDTAAVPERPGVPVVDDNAAVRRVVAEYGRAIETKDVALFRSLKPNLSREEERRLQEGFRAVTSQRVNLTVVSVEIRDQTASALVQRLDTVNAGGRQRTVESRQTFRLTRAAGGWVIEDIR